MDCATCKKSIEQSEECFECDGCWAMQHAKCCSVKKTELAARKNSKCLKIFCEKCFNDTSRAQSETLQLILKYVYKIDKTTQTQIENNKNVELSLQKITDGQNEDNNKITDLIDRVESTKSRIDERCDQMSENILKPIHSDVLRVSEKKAKSNEPTYASVLRTSDKAVIVRPKKKDSNSEATKQMLMGMIDPCNSGVNQIKMLSNGTVMITCNDNEAVELIEKEVKEKEGENYIISEMESSDRKKRLKVMGMSKKYETEELEQLIKKQHLSESENASVRVLKIYTDKNMREESYNAIMEFDAETAEAMLNARKISIGWDMCKVFMYIRINRCFKCLGYNHLAKDCKNKLACSKCGGEHKVETCKSKDMSCVNCVEYARKNNVNINTKHHAFAYKCHCTQQICNKMNSNSNRDK